MLPCVAGTGAPTTLDATVLLLGECCPLSPLPAPVHVHVDGHTRPCGVVGVAASQVPTTGSRIHRKKNPHTPAGGLWVYPIIVTKNKRTSCPYCGSTSFSTRWWLLCSLCTWQVHGHGVEGCQAGEHKASVCAHPLLAKHRLRYCWPFSVSAFWP